MSAAVLAVVSNAVAHSDSLSNAVTGGRMRVRSPDSFTKEEVLLLPGIVGLLWGKTL